MPVTICDVCDEPAAQGRPLVRVYALDWSPLDVHEDCWSDDDADSGTPVACTTNQAHATPNTAICQPANHGDVHTIATIAPLISTCVP